MKFRTMIVTALTAALALFGPAAAASAAEERVDPVIAGVLAEVPGGIVVDANHAVWPALDMEMTTAADDQRLALSSVGTCSSGLVCAYSGSSLSGTRMSWSTCGDHTVPSSFSVRSIADARSTGKLQARNGTTVLATAYAGGWANVSGTTTYVRCTF